MVATVLSVYKRALSAISTRSTVAATNEASKEAETCTLWYDHVRDLVAGTAPWPSLSAVSRLALLATRDNDDPWVSGDPNPGFFYAYALPSDMLRPRHLANYGRFQISTRSNVSALMGDGQDSMLLYTRRESNPALWGIDLEDATVFALAAHIAFPLTGSLSKAQGMAAMAEKKIIEARVRVANESDYVLDWTPEWLSARGSAYGGPVSRYIYPNADFVLQTTASIA